MGIALREFHAGDVEAMYALDVVCFEPVFRFSKRSIRRFAEAHGAVTVLAVSRMENYEELAGFVIAQTEGVGEERVGYVVTLDVAPTWRRQGVAARLMAEVEAKVLAAGGRAMELHVFTGNAGALRFYEDEGYVRLGMQPEFYGPKLDALVYGKRIEDTGANA